MSNGRDMRIVDLPTFAPLGSDLVVAYDRTAGVTKSARVDSMGPVLNAKSFGAVGDGATNDLPAIQAALDACATAGGGRVHLPAGQYKLLESGGKGIILRHKVELVGDHFVATTLVPSGTWTDSVIRGDFRDDNNANIECNTGMRDLGVQMSTTSAVWCLDLVGMRSSVFSDLYLNGSGTASTGQVAINVGEWNPANTSRKSCFFNQLMNIKGDGTGWGTWIRMDARSNVSNNIFDNHNAYCRIMMDLSSSTQNSQNTYIRGYFLGDSNAASYSFKTPGGTDLKANGIGLLLHWDWEFFTNQPAGSNSTRSLYLDLPKPAQMIRLTVPGDGYISLDSGSPLMAQDVTDAFVLSGMGCISSGPTAVVVHAGVAYNRSRVNLVGDALLSLTNTGSAHTEYIVCDQSAEAGRVTIQLTPPAATDLPIASVSVSSTGTFISQTDLRVFYPSVQLRGISGTATRAKNLRGFALPVTAGATFYDVVFPVAEPDTQYTVFTSTRWLTTCSIGSYSTTGFRITFGSACPVGGSNLDWLIIR